MTEFYKRNKKKLIFTVFLFLLFFGGYWNIKYNLPKTVEFIVKFTLGPTFKSKEISFEKNKILIKDFIFKDGEETIIESPKIEILYDKESLKQFRIKEIVMEGGTANITRRKNGDINIVAAFTGPSSNEEPTEKEEEEKIETYDPGISIPIDKITGKNVTTVFNDLSYRLPIKKIAYNTNGELTFSKVEGINMHFIGSNEKEVYDFSFSTSKEPYSMTIKLSNINVETELVQYGYDGEEVSYEGGLLNMDLTIASSGMLGWIKFDDVDVKYKDLNDKIKKVSGDVIFKEEGIFLTAEGLVFGKKENFTLTYINDELNIDFDLKNIEKENLQKLSYLNNVEIPFERINIDDVKFNLNLSKELKISILTFIKELKKDNLKLNDTKLEFVYDNLGIHIKNLETNIFLLDEKENINIKEKLKSSLDFFSDEGKLKINLENKNGKNYIPNLTGELDFKILEDRVNFLFNSNIVNLEGRFLTKEKKFIFEKKNDYLFVYDIENKKIEDGLGKIDFYLFNNKFILDYTIKNENLTINNFAVVDEETQRKELEITGHLALDTLAYDFRYFAKNLSLNQFLGEELGYLNGDFKGNISGKKDKFLGEIDIRRLSIKYYGELKDLKAKLVFNKEEDLNLDFDGEIGSLSYEDYNINGLLVALRLKNNIFEIKNINNQFLNISGTIDLNKDKIDINSKVSNLSLEKFRLEYPKVLLKDIDGKIYGKLSAPKGSVNIKDLEIDINDGELVKINGNINYSNKKLFTNDLKINNSLFQGKYLLEDNKYSGKINIIEENLGRYYKDRRIKYRVIGTSFIEGQGKEIELKLKSTIDKIYLQGNRLPNIYLDINYSASDFVDGIVKINEVVFSNQNLENLINLNGIYDVKGKELQIYLRRQQLNFSKLKEYIPLENIQGNLELVGYFGGKIDDLKYNLGIESKDFSIENINFDGLRLKLDGSLERVVLGEFSFEYMKNKYLSEGEYNIATNTYFYHAYSDEINLDFLNAFLAPYGISEIKGIANFDFNLRDNTNTGYLSIKDFNFKKEDLFLKLERFNSKIRLRENNLVVEDFSGLLNDGKLNLKGFIELPKLKEVMENPYFKENLKYSFDLSLDDVKYRYGDYFNFDLNSNISFKENKLLGSIEILRGEVLQIPNTSKSIFQKIKEFIFGSASDTVNQSEDLGEDFKIETVFENAIELNLNFRIVEGIKLDIETLNSFVTDVKGLVIGNGSLSGKEGKYIVLGSIETIGGSLNVNDNIFYLDRTLVVFNDKKSYLPEVNPTLLVDARVDVQDEQLGMSLNGTLDDLKFNISSKNGSSSGNLNSLLTDTENVGENNEVTTTLITNVIGGQLTQVLKPVSNLIKNTLNISKFRISSNLLSEANKNNNEESQRRLRLGAVLEAEDNIYKDKIWWVAKGTLLEEDDQESENRNSNGNGAFKEYDFSLEYRFDLTKSIGIGVGKLAEDVKTASDKESKNKLNYHIDFKFEKKYDNLIDIFINK